MRKQFGAALCAIAMLWSGTVDTAFPQELLLSAPPAHDRRTSLEIYQPVAGLLSEITGASVTYHHPGNWPNYLRDMQAARFDFIIDGAHFLSWRQEKIEHRPLLSLGQSLTYVVASPETLGIGDIFALRNRPVCAAIPPSLDALTVLDQFGSDLSAPRLVPSRGYVTALQLMSEGRCDAAVMPQAVYRQRAAAGQFGEMRILFQSIPLPHYGLSASPRVPREMQERIIGQLAGRPAPVSLAPLLGAFGLPAGNVLVEADADAYSGYAYLLEDYWGF